VIFSLKQLHTMYFSGFGEMNREWNVLCLSVLPLSKCFVWHSWLVNNFPCVEQLNGFWHL